MNSIILIAACAVCLDQLFFRGRLASYVVDNLKGPKKKHTGHDAAPHTPKAGSLARQTPEILVSKSYRCGLERTGADIGTAPAGGDAIFAPASEEKSAMASWNGLVVQPPIGEDGSSCDARRAGLRGEHRHGRRHGRGAAGHRQLRHPGLCLIKNDLRHEME